MKNMKRKETIGKSYKYKEQKAQRATKTENLSLSEGKIKGAKPYFAGKQKKLRKL